MPTGRKTLTTDDGPAVVSEKSLRALVAIRREKLLPLLYGRVVAARSVREAMRDVLADKALEWLEVADDRPEQALPARVANANPSDAATLRLALGIGASIVILEEPVKEKAKLSFIKAEGVVSMLVLAYRQGHLSAVRPMVVALEKLGHGAVLPPPERLEALWVALEKLG